jgi:polysaccharide biosynthesis/export protein
MSRTFACFAFLLIPFAIPHLMLAADEPGRLQPAKPHDKGSSTAPSSGPLVRSGSGTLILGSPGINVGAQCQPTGSGTLVIVGSNTYSGDTVISGGVLSLGSPGVDSAKGTTRSGTIVNDGTLNVSAYVTGSAGLPLGNSAWSTSEYAYFDEAGAGRGNHSGVSAVRTPIAQIPKGPVFYIVTEGAGLGDSVRAVPCTGKETVLSAVSAVNGISAVSSTRIWIARPLPNSGDKSSILTVDWDAISKKGHDATNFKLMPGDRLVFGEDPQVTQSNLLGKKVTPIERVAGILGLIASTVRGLQHTPGADKLVTGLVQQGLITDDEKLKTLLLDALHKDEGKKTGATTEGPKPHEGKEPSHTAGGNGTGEQKADHATKKSTATVATTGPTITIRGTLKLDSISSPATGAAAPHELAMQPLPAYHIEPPDVISVEMLKMVPLPPYRAEVFDVLQIRASATPDHPIQNNYIIQADGTVDLGPPYGSVKVAGKTLGEMREALNKSLAKYVREPDAYVQLARISGLQSVTGQYLVGPDGTINLKKYGLVRISGKTVAEARLAIQKHLRQFLDAPEVSVNVVAYNSKVYYVIIQGAGLGDSVRRFPLTGKETVLDAISQINGLSQVSGKNIRVVRPSATKPQGAAILPVDWDAVSRRGETATNYQLFAGDRVYICEDPLVTQTNLVAKKTSSLERAMGIIGLTASSVQSLNSTPNAGKLVKELLRNGVFDSDPELKRTVQKIIRIGEQGNPKAAAQASH